MCFISSSKQKKKDKKKLDDCPNKVFSYSFIESMGFWKRKLIAHFLKSCMIRHHNCTYNKQALLKNTLKYLCPQTRTQAQTKMFHQSTDLLLSTKHLIELARVQSLGGYPLKYYNNNTHWPWSLSAFLLISYDFISHVCRSHTHIHQNCNIRWSPSVIETD